MPKIRDLSDEELLLEWAEWDRKIRKATSWGAALGAANEFRAECQREIDRRNQPPKPLDWSGIRFRGSCIDV